MKTKPIFARAVAVLSALVFVLTSCGKTETEKTTAPTTQHVHSWTEATPYEPKTCTVCGATEGEKLQPEFEKYGIEVDEIHPKTKSTLKASILYILISLVFFCAITQRKRISFGPLITIKTKALGNQ